MSNIEFSFLYRDAGNYKTYGSVVLSNPDDMPADIIGKTILRSCNGNGNFDPVPWGIPNIRTQPFDP